MDDNVKQTYRILCWLLEHDRLHEAGIVQFIEQEETDWYEGAHYISDLTNFLRKYRVENSVIMDRKNGL